MDIIEVRIEIDHTALGWTLNPVQMSLQETQRGHMETLRSHMKKEAETGVRLPHAQRCWSHQKFKEARDYPRRGLREREALVTP